MAKTRNAIPKQVQDAVLKEFDHRCAACPADRPHLHHIDGDPANNDPMNLIPLCPNCHLGGQHDASKSIPPAILAFFRRYKHRLILTPQFKPLWNRMTFLEDVSQFVAVASLTERAGELTAFVSRLAMGDFYSERLASLFALPGHGGLLILGGSELEDRRYDAAVAERDTAYRQHLRDSRPEVERLLVELLDFQNWLPVGK